MAKQCANIRKMFRINEANCQNCRKINEMSKFMTEREELLIQTYMERIQNLC